MFSLKRITEIMCVVLSGKRVTKIVKIRVNLLKLFRKTV